MNNPPNFVVFCTDQQRADFGYDTVDFMIGESLLATEGDHHAEWLCAHLGADWIDNDAPPVEKGGMTATDSVPTASRTGASCSTWRRARASTSACSTIPRTARSGTAWPSASNRAFRPGPMPEPH